LDRGGAHRVQDGTRPHGTAQLEADQPGAHPPGADQLEAAQLETPRLTDTSNEAP
jgi:hypothetical protein